MKTLELATLPTQTPVACCVPLDAPTIRESEAEATAALFKSLADPARVRILNVLANASEPVCVCDFVAHLGLSQPTVSHHLKKLSNAGLLRREQRGVWAYYSIAPTALDRLSTVVHTTKQGGDQ